MARRLGKYVMNVILLDAAVIGVAAVLGLLLGMRAARDLGVLLEFGGVLVTLLSVGSIMGDDAAVRSASYQYGQSVTQEGMNRRVELSPEHRRVDLAKFFQYVLAGAIVLIIGLIVAS